jgi:hypothetical protein
MQKLEVSVPQTLLVTLKNPVNLFQLPLNYGAMPHYEPEIWRDDPHAGGEPSLREQCGLLDLLGRINYRILSGNKVYVEVGGVVYKTIYGGYWRSVFTGIEHYLLHCEQVSTAVWKEEKTTAIDLPIAYSNGGWTTRGHSLSFLLNRDQPQTAHKTRRFSLRGRRQAM